MKHRLHAWRKDSSGVTLIELVVTILILGIVMSAIFTFFKFGNQMTINGESQYIVQSETRLAVSEIISEVRYANEIYLIDSAAAISEKGSTNYSYIYISGNTVYYSIYDLSTGTRSENDVGDTFILAECYFAKVAGSTDNLYIILSGQNKTQTYTVDATVKLPNLTLASPSVGVQGATSSSAIKFKVPVD